uniref:Tetraspanin n=1 Tax=Panagrellus redivivus TaxID=6233 RepID=A0A7E4W022_PANRE
MVEGGVTLVKYILFLVNFIIWISGMGMVIAAGVLQMRYTGLYDILGNPWFATPHLLIVCGLTCTVIGFLGCCGAIRENYCLTVSFAVLLSGILLVEFFGIIFAYTFHQPLRENVEQQLQMGLERYQRSPGVQMAWDETQQQFSCCGVYNSSDWASIPDSCCIHLHNGCARMPQPLLYHVGCVDAIQAWVTENVALVSGVAAAVAVVQIIGVCFSCCLSKSILRDFHDYYY